MYVCVRERKNERLDNDCYTFEDGGDGGNDYTPDFPVVIVVVAAVMLAVAIKSG